MVWQKGDVAGGNLEFMMDEKSLGERALEIMLRRGWHPQKCTKSDDWIVRRSLQDQEQTEPVLLSLYFRYSGHKKNPLFESALEASYDKNPFLALIKCDEYYKKHIEKVG